MKRILISVLAAASMTAAVTPAFAQPYRGDDARYGERYDRGDGYGNINARQAALAQRVEDGARSGALTRWEVRQFRRELNSLEQLEQRYRSDRDGYRYGRGGGLDGRERADLENRLNILSQKIERAMRDWDRRRY